MIRVYKDRDTKLVTKGAYETFYKPLGYKIAIEEKKIVTKELKDKKETIKSETKTRSNKEENKEEKELEETKEQEENKEEKEHKDFDESEDLE